MPFFRSKPVATGSTSGGFLAFLKPKAAQRSFVVRDGGPRKLPFPPNMAMIAPRPVQAAPLKNTRRPPVELSDPWRQQSERPTAALRAPSSDSAQERRTRVPSPMRGKLAPTPDNKYKGSQFVRASETRGKTVAKPPPSSGYSAGSLPPGTVSQPGMPRARQPRFREMV